LFRLPSEKVPTDKTAGNWLKYRFVSISRLSHLQSPSTFDCCQGYATMTRLRALCTLPSPFRSLRSVNNGRVAIHRSPVFGSTQIRRFSSHQTLHSPLDAEPSDNPNFFDVLLIDIDHHVLHRGVSEKLDCSYLSRATKTLKPIPEIKGVLFGSHCRPFFSLITTYEQTSCNLHFLFDTSSPFTYFSYDVS
jgi:hypothetical protein